MNSLGSGKPIGGYASQQKAKIVRESRKIKRKEMKLNLKQRFRNWLMSEDREADIPQTVETSSLNSEGMRLQVYKANGGFVIETRTYDRQKDRHYNTMHIITDNEELGDKLGQIVTMEALR